MLCFQVTTRTVRDSYALHVRPIVVDPQTLNPKP